MEPAHLYQRKIFKQNKKKDIPYYENEIPSHLLNTIIHSSCLKMEQLPDHSVHLMVTSPPYNVGKEYDKDITLDEFREQCRCIWKEVYRVLVPGGRACINIGNIGRNPYIPFAAYTTIDMLDVGFIMRGDIIWDKQTLGTARTAWGSWLLPSNPVIRDRHEYILVFSKDTLTLKNPKKNRSSMNKDEFLQYTQSIWSMTPETRKKKIGHPAPFPVQLPFQCIQFYTFENNVVLDPMIGSGTTAIAALKLKRKYIGYESNLKYIELAKKRIEREVGNELF